MSLCELTCREVEYVALSNDTTESDLKQRREIRNQTAYYVDQGAVRAATEGRVLIIDGVEKVEEADREEYSGCVVEATDQLEAWLKETGVETPVRAFSVSPLVSGSRV